MSDEDIERRRVSNETIAVLVGQLQSSQTSAMTLLSKQISDGFAGVERRLDRHESSISQLNAGVGQLREDMARMDERTTALEEHREEQLRREADAAGAARAAAAKGAEAVDELRLIRRVVGWIVAGAGLIGVLLAIVNGLHLLS